MPGLVLTRWLELLRASWRGQLGVLAGSAVLLGALAAVVPASAGRIALGASIALVSLCMFSWSARVAGRTAGIDGFVADDGSREPLRPALAALPRMVTGTAIVGTPAAVVAGAWFVVASGHPLLGVLLVLPAFSVGVLVVGPVLLAATGAALGERSWHPRAAVDAARRAPLRLAGSTVLVGLLVALAVVPVVLAALVAQAVLPGPLAALCVGFALGGWLPLLGCAGVAIWSTAVGRVGTGAHGASAAAPEAELSFEPRMTPVLAPVDGPAWEAVLDGGGVWGAWLRLPAAATVAFRIQWVGAAPSVAFGRADGTWRAPAVQASTSGDLVHGSFEAGDTYVQLTSCSPVAQPVAVALVGTGAAAAA